MIFITGGSGFIGRSLVRTLNRRQLPFRHYGGRIHDPLRLRQELPGATTVIHLASAESRGRTRAVKHVDVEGTERLIEECRRAEIAHLILVSRLGADPNSIYPLLRAKGEQERIIRQSGIPYSIVRSATLFGREDRFLNVIAGLAAWTWPFIWLPGSGRSTWQPLWVEDLTRCLVAVTGMEEMKGKTVEIAGEERFRYLDLARLVLLITGQRRTMLPVHLRIVRPAAMATLSWWAHPPVSRFFLDRFSVPDVADQDSVLRHFNFRPARVPDHIAYLRRPHLRRYLFYGRLRA
jgi:NADH dehydrogenase